MAALQIQLFQHYELFSRDNLLCVPKSYDPVVTAPFFVATKLEAFRGRGDYTNSHDLEDPLTVIDCREVIVSEIAGAMEVRHYIAEQFRTLLATRAFVDALPGYLLPDASSQRVRTVRAREAH